MEQRLQTGGPSTRAGLKVFVIRFLFLFCLILKKKS